MVTMIASFSVIWEVEKRSKTGKHLRASGRQ